MKDYVVTEFTEDKEIRRSAMPLKFIYADAFFSKEDVGIWVQNDKGEKWEVVEARGHLFFRRDDKLNLYLIEEKLTECDADSHNKFDFS